MTPIDDTASGAATPDPGAEQAHFRRTLIRVMTVQLIALAILWLLQSRYTY